MYYAATYLSVVGKITIASDEDHLVGLWMEGQKYFGDTIPQEKIEMNKISMASQAVGGAVGHNPISIIIPCHRVVGANGSLTGYAGGVGIKVKLLEIEGVDMSSLFIPKKGTSL